LDSGFRRQKKTEVAVNGAEIYNRMPDRTVYAGLSPDTHKTRSAISGIAV